jgi:acetyl/propionyl-CoA carboxylase alpha subunit/acetyl-CoA carboxylase carboxyltransferase component
VFDRVAIVNRGEAAVRLIHAIQEFNHERRTDIRTIALYTEPERRAMFVREADEAVRIGGLSGRGAQPYLDHRELERALRESKADAVWVGWGFVSEDASFADLCARLELLFIGPSAEAMRRLGDKIGAKLLAEQAGAPVTPWSGGPVQTLEDARRWGNSIGYPLMVKAAAGRGGRGIRSVARPAELEFAFQSVCAEALKAFGDGTVFLERLVTGGRHVEVQVIADNYGGVWGVGVCDCSIQRRNQKLIEESSSTALSHEQEGELRTAAVSLVRAAGYRGAATVEFLYQPEERALAFLEVNTRLQVEHPVTEITTGLDLVKLQLDLARGARLEGEPPPAVGHSIEARLNAEDPERAFAPAPGTIEFLELPTGPGIRVDTGIAEGDVIPSEYGSIVAKIIAWGRDRAEARARLRRALAQTRVLIRGGTTNKTFLLEILDRPEVVTGIVDTRWLDRLVPEVGRSPARHAHVALVAATIDAYDAEAEVNRDKFFASAFRGRPQASREIGHLAEFVYWGTTYRLRAARLGPQGRYRVEVESQRLDVHVERLRRFEARYTFGDRAFHVFSHREGTDYLVEVDGISHRLSLEEGGVIRAPASALVVRVNVAAGNVVDAGDSVAVVESMKMETAILAPFAGRVREVFVTSNVQVYAGSPLLRLEPLPDDGAAADLEKRPVRFNPLVLSADASDPRTRNLERLEVLRCMILGFDFSPADARQLVQEYSLVRNELPANDPELLGAELAILRAFADLCELSLNRSAGDEADEEEARSTRELFNAYLRSLDVEREGLPGSFRERLSRAVAHYGVLSLERTPKLEESVYRIFYAQQRVSSQLPAVLELLDLRLEPTHGLPTGLLEDLRDTLDRLIAATQLRYPVVGEAARSVRFRSFDQPLIEHSREQVYEAMREQLAYLAAHPETPDYAERIETLVACPQPLIRLLPERIGRTGTQPHEPMLEVLTRRYYKIRPLENFHSFATHGRQFVTADYEHEGRRHHIVTTQAEASDFDAAADSVSALVRQMRAKDTVRVDFYLWWRGAPDLDLIASELDGLVNSIGFPDAVDTIAVAVTGREGTAAGGSEAGADHFTFRRAGKGFREQVVVRGLHRMIARRLQLSQLSNFHLARLPSTEDVFLFHCKARGNPADERLVALAEVRDLTPVRDHSGRVRGLPQLEQVLAACLDGIRSAQGHRSAQQRLQWNRVFLYVWPPIEGMPLEELLAVGSTLTPMMEGLGLEELMIQGRIPEPPGGELRERVLRIATQPTTGVTMLIDDPPTEPLQPLDAYSQKVLRARRSGAVYPYELLPLVTRALEAPPGSPSTGTFTEHDLDESGRLAPVSRPHGGNAAGIVVGVVRTPTSRYPEGLTRVALFGDPTKALGSIAEPECRRIIGAIDLAEELCVPVEWFALSSGAKISMDSGTENMDWVSRVLARIIRFTQAGGQINVIVTGINVGAQPYWNAEATMLMHTRGILVMTPDSAMVLTGKQALEYSGGVSAEDNFGIGGYDRVMGPNGQAQYWAPDVAGAVEILLAHYEHAYVAPGERFPRRAVSLDPIDRDISDEPHVLPHLDFTKVGDIFSEDANPGRKKPFDIRTLMRATIDKDHAPLERWAGMQDADTAVVFDAHLGGYPVSVLGVESRPIQRHGLIPTDGPDQWTAGTLFPLSSKKIARALNAASGNRPMIVLANLSGFDGSPESLRKRQLEYGAEIGRAVVNFDGPIVFCVVSRYHGGAFVVFSGALNDGIEVIALEGSYASVIGGAPAAAVVFAGEVNARTKADPRVRELEARVAVARDNERAQLRSQLIDVTAAVRSEKLGDVAAEFDSVHSVERALRVGSIHKIIPPSKLRPYLIKAVERGIRHAMERARGEARVNSVRDV